jgi:hypothetical protein
MSCTAVLSHSCARCCCVNAVTRYRLFLFSLFCTIRADWFGVNVLGLRSVNNPESIYDGYLVTRSFFRAFVRCVTYSILRPPRREFFMFSASDVVVLSVCCLTLLRFAVSCWTAYNEVACHLYCLFCGTHLHFLAVCRISEWQAVATY